MSSQSITMPFPARLRSPLRFDPVLIGLALTLFCGGLVILASASVSATDEPLFYLKRQLVAASIGIAGAAVCLYVPMRIWQAFGPLLLLTAFAMLIVVLLPGVGYTVNGATRWVRFGFINLQVSEPARLFFLIYLAGYLVRRNRQLREGFVGFLPPMVLLCIACALLLAEPDFGAAVVLAATLLAMVFVAGARLRDVFAFIGSGVIAMSVLAITSPYRMDRLIAFTDPWSRAFDSGFQLTQSLIAIGRGEVFGVGLGDSVQKLFYLPEAHTDFVFAVFAEEFGLVGALTLIALFSLLLWRIFNLAGRAAKADRPFEAYLAVGIGTWIGLQAFINMGVNMGLLPTKGLTLPMISYGRSSLIIMLIAIGLLLRIHHELVTDPAPANRKGGSRRRRTKRS
ncbi:MAG: putative lipid II flippase FtsW [Pseudomonadota bacterium]